MAALGTSIAKWYVAKLKAYPIMTNLSSAFVLMTTGDLAAQELETRNRNRLNSTRTADRNNKDGLFSNELAYQQSNAFSSLSLRSFFETLEEKLNSWDPKRTVTMAAWSVCIYTPFYIGLYRVYDRYLPKQTSVGILARVGLSFLTSVPINAAFYTYGAAAHHTIEWLESRKKLQEELEELGLESYSAYQAAASIPFPHEAFLSQAAHKLENELPTTVLTSGTCWIPFNLFTFSVVPAHLRPVSLMIFSAFWNCYLSLSQHRDSGVSEFFEEKSESL